MAGWQNSNEEVYVSKVEEIIDTNPDLYKQRTIQALNEKKYEDALKDVELALRYSSNELQYQILKTRVLYESHRFSECLRYIQSSDVWRKRESEEILDDEYNFIYVAFAESFRACGENPRQLEFVIVTPSGNGMYSSIREAIKYKSSSQKIFLTTGTYCENLKINNDVEITSSIRCKPVIKSDYAAVYVNKGRLKMSNLTIWINMNASPELENDDDDSDSEEGNALTVGEKGHAEIENVQISVLVLSKKGVDIQVIDLSVESNYIESKIYNIGEGISVRGGSCVAKNIKINSAGSGVCVSENGSVDISASVIDGCSVGVMVLDGNCKLQNTRISSKMYGIMNADEEKFDATNISCENVTIRGASVGVFLFSNNNYAEFENCTVKKNKIGYIVSDSKCNINNCKIISNKQCNLLGTRVAEVFAKNTIIAGSRGYGILMTDDASCKLESCEIKDNLKEAIFEKGNGRVYLDSQTKKADNDPVGWFFGGVGRFLDSL